jgi:hypothetical protein
VEGRRDDRETNDFAFILRSICPSAYEIARDGISMPKVNHPDHVYRDEINEVQRAIFQVVFLPNLHQHYLKTYVSGKYQGVMM